MVWSMEPAETPGRSRSTTKAVIDAGWTKEEPSDGVELARLPRKQWVIWSRRERGAARGQANA